MELLFLSERFPPDIGGVAASARRIATALASLGHRVQLVTLVRDLTGGSVASQTLAPNLTVHRIGQSRHIDFTLQQLLNFLEWLHQKHSFRAIWGHYLQTAGFVAAWVGRRFGVPSLLAVRGNDLDRLLFPPGDFARLEWSLRNCHRIVTVTADLAAKVRALVGREAFVLPNSVDTDLFQPGPSSTELAERYGLKADELILGFSGELRAKKGMTFLLEAFRQVRHARPTRLLVIGEVRPRDRGEYVRTLAAAGSADGVVVSGHISEPEQVVRHLCLCGLFLLPSLWEGMPNSLLEAMATGVPVIASDAGGIPEVVRDGVTGLLLPRTHLHRLGPRIEEWLALSAERRALMVHAARQAVLERYSLERERERLANLLGNLGAPSSEPAAFDTNE
jgi:glycosyltransferase involved in cell wall biosynthesis